MGSISVTFTDAETGVVNTSVNITANGIKRILVAMKTTYEEMENNVAPEYTVDDDGKEVEVPRERVVLNYRQVCDRLVGDFVGNLIRSSIDNECKILLRGMNIKPIEVEGQD